MRAELPWNVAGIPPETREAARAAARREGLSVGEWLTRRILHNFPGDEIAYMPYRDRAPPDSWDLPPPPASRHDTEDMMARIGRGENESHDAWRRIEDQLRSLSRRLDSFERSYGESSRVISRTTQEMNITAREQTQAFDQLSLTVMALNERLQRLERSTAHDGLKDAVKALHQGLSRLAAQITATANNSASQVATLTSSLEQLAGRVSQARIDSEEAGRALEARVDAANQAVDTRLEAISHSIDGRLSTVEQTAQFNSNVLDHALEKIEAFANQRTTDQIENQTRAAQHEEMLNRLEDSIARLEMRLPDADFERRLDSIERSVSDLTERLEKYNPNEQFDASLQAVSCRLDSLEKEHNDLLNEWRDKGLGPVEPPPCAEPSPAAESPPEAVFSPAEATDAFATSFMVEFPGEAPAGPPEPPAFAEVLADTSEPENFLVEACRSARAASEKVESECRGGFAAFRWSREAAVEGEEKARSRYLLPVLVALLLAAAAAALILSQRAKQRDVAMAPHPATATGPTYSVPPDANAPPFGVAPQAGGQPQGDEKNDNIQRSEFDYQDDPAPAAAPPEQRDARNALVAPAPEGAKAGTPPPDDKVIQLANAGNPVALTILGLRALDGTPPNLADAAKFLEQAAEKGQAVAQYRLGTLYERGQGIAADPAKAAHWYEMAASQGNRKAMHNLAVSYASGANGGRKNMVEAARWFAKAAALGLPDSQFNLAVLYERGDGVPQSLLDAFKWYSIAAASGDSESRQRMGALAPQLSDSDKAAANKAAATFRAAPLDRSANVPPEAADLGG